MRKLLVAGVMAASVATGQAAGPVTTDPATADLTAYLSQKNELQPADVAGRLALAHWAVSHEMWSQAAEMAQEALDRDPDSRPAWTILQQVDGVVLLPTDGAAEGALKAEFQKRYGREFKTRNARHFLLCYDTTDSFAMQRAGALEKAYDAFLFNFDLRKLRPTFLTKRLVVILFKNRDDYLKYAQQTEGADLSWAAGYFSQRTNRTAFFDDSTSEGAASVDQQVAQLKAQLKDLNNKIYIATARGQTGEANNLTVQRNRISEQITWINLQVGNIVGNFNNEKTVHEAAHQLAFNTGIQTRLVDYPLWFSEGLACCFETEDGEHRRGPGVVNTGRSRALKEALAKGEGVALETLIEYPPPEKMDAEMLGVFYAEGWALFHYLYRTNRTGLEKYLLAYKALPVMRMMEPDQRLKLFTDAFGNDIETLQKNFAMYVKGLPSPRRQ